MKTIYSYLATISALLTIAAFSSCSGDINYIDNIIERDTYIYCDLSSYTFDSNGEKSLTLEVESSSEWEYSVADKADWINITKNENGLTIEVDTNETGDIRNGIIAFENKQGNKFSFYLTQEFTVKPTTDHLFFKTMDFPIVISTNGNYAAYVDMRVIDEVNYITQYTPVIINMKTGEVKLCESNTEEREEASCISNAGILATFKTGSLTARLYDVNEGAARDIYEPNYIYTNICAMNSDASVMAGYVCDYKFYPCKWIDGQLNILDIPEESIYGVQTGLGAMVRGGNADLSILYGSDWQWGSYAPIVWKNGKAITWGSDTTEEMIVLEDEYDYWGNWIGTKEVTVISGPRMTNDQFHMSIDGKYTTCCYKRWTKTGDGYGVRTDYPIVYNTSDNTCEILEDMFACYGMHVTNEGVVFVSDFSDNLQAGYTYDREFGKVEKTTDWIFRKYGVIVPDHSVVTYISEDGNTVSGKAFRNNFNMAFYLYWVFGNTAE